MKDATMLAVTTSTIAKALGCILIPGLGQVGVIVTSIQKQLDIRPDHTDTERQVPLTCVRSLVLKLGPVKEHIYLNLKKF